MMTLWVERLFLEGCSLI